MPATPARKISISAARRGPLKAHIPYRGDNPEVGKKTGIAVRHVERKSDGFEPFDELIEQADKRTPPQLKVSKKKKQSIPAPEEELDEYGEMSMDIDSPRQYFANSRQPVTPIVNRNGSSSRTVARTSDIDFDHIPSPRSWRKSAGPHSSRSRLSASYVAPEDFSDDNDNVPDYAYGGHYDDQPDSSDEQDAPQGTSFREMGEDDDDEQQDQPDEEPEETPPPSKRDKGKGRAALSDVPEERESDIEDEIAQSLEDVRHTYSDEELPLADEPEPSPPRTKKIKITEEPSKPTRQRGRPKKENRIYREGVRKSAREHYKPLEWWRGEKLVYGRPQGSCNGHVLVPPIKEIIRIPKETPEPLGKRKRSTRGRSKTANGPHYEVIPVANPEKGWDDKTDNFCIIVDYDTREEVERQVAYFAKDVEEEMVENHGWKYMKAFGDSDFIAAGVLEIPPKQKKPTKQAKDNTYIFYIIEGAVSLKLHNTNLMLATGAMFIVPRGNSYYIENICERSVKLFFTQARKVVEDIAPSFAAPRRLSIGATASYGRSSSARAVQKETRALSGAPAPKRATSTR